VTIKASLTPDNLILALDVESGEEALRWVDRLQSRIGTFKVGLQLFTARGPDLVREIRNRGGQVFLDLKLHDIPNTVAKSVESVGKLDLRFLTIHTLGGRQMMAEAAKAAAAFPQTRVLGVTILTSHTNEDLGELGFNHTVPGQVAHLARLAYASGLRGLVCSPLEVPIIRREMKKYEDLVLVTPGVRPEGSPLDDQARVTTPEEAIGSGSNYVVLGRPVLKAERPEEVLDRILTPV
jgi:orotidine-5'-phosphate decarboxylase